MRNKNTLKAMNTIQAGAIKGNDGASNVTKNLVYVSKATPSDVAALQQAHQARSLSFCLIFISAFSSACNRFSIILIFSSAATSSSWNFSAQAAFVFNSAPKRETKTELMGMCNVPTGQMCAWVRNCCLTQAVSKTALLQTASGAWLQGCSFKSTLADDSFLVNISRISSASFFKSSFISSFNFVLFCAAGAS